MREYIGLLIEYAPRIGVTLFVGLLLWIALRPTPKKKHEQRGFDVADRNDHNG